MVSYKGIPFAEPPIGDKRFSPPQDLQVWDGVLDCREYAPMAIQTADEPGLEKSEDCLIPCTIAVALDESPKCPRCWNHSEHIGADGHHNQLCDRCAAVVGE